MLDNNLELAGRAEEYHKSFTQVISFQAETHWTLHD